jgi:hypothetical protein
VIVDSIAELRPPFGETSDSQSPLFDETSPSFDETESEDESRSFDRPLALPSYNRTKIGTAADAHSSGHIKTNRPSKKEKKAAYTRSGEKIKAWEYNMTGHCRTAIEKYLELAGLNESDLKPVATPCIDDHQLKEGDLEVKGELSPIAARVVLTALYLARHNRPDIYWAVNHMSRNLTKWTIADDKRLHRLISFMHYTSDCIQFAYVGDDLKDCFLVMFCDAGFAGDLNDSKSTGGASCYIIGPSTLVPIAWVCKKQGATSHSSTEAEIITLDMGLRAEGIPLLFNDNPAPRSRPPFGATGEPSGSDSPSVDGQLP